MNRPEVKAKISQSLKIAMNRPETKAKRSATNARREIAKVECPHCGKIGAKGNMTRYHFDNCKNYMGQR